MESLYTHAQTPTRLLPSFTTFPISFSQFKGTSWRRSFSLSRLRKYLYFFSEILHCSPA